MISDIDARINLISQGEIPNQDGERWFTSLDVNTQLLVVQRLIYFILQSGAREDDAEQAVEASGLKRTFTPCMLVVKGSLRIQLSKIANLPEIERKKSFILLMTFFTHVDGRRRNTDCKDGCSHWWHNKKELQRSLINGST